MVLDGYLMTSMGLKEDLAGDRAERMQEKKHNTLLQGCSVNLKAGIGYGIKHLHV